MIDIVKYSSVFAALITTTLPAIAQDADASDWNWTAEAYFWGADLGGSTTSGARIKMPIEDIVDDLNIGFMGTVFAEKGNWLLFADAFYLDIDESDSADASVGFLTAEVDGSFEMQGASSTFGGGYKFLQNHSTKLYATGGIRFLWLDAEVEVDGRLSLVNLPPVERQVTEKEVGNNWDAVIGLRGSTDLSDKWYLSYYGDVGAGNSDFTWQASLAANYRMRRTDLVIGYRYLEFDLDNFGPIDELTMEGPFLGLKFSF